jgi:hypothetical protein
MTLFLIGGIAGVVLGQRCKMLVLLPVTCVALAVVALDAGAHGDGLLRMVLMMIGTVTCLQLGYVLGSVTALMAEASHAGARDLSDERSLSQSSRGYS